MQDRVPFDVDRDFAPITLASRQPNVLVVHPSLPVNSVRDLIGFAKARPGMLNYASGSTGSANHLAAELFKSMAGINIVRVNFKGAAAGLLSVITGEVHLMFASTAAALPQMQAGKVKTLAVTTLEQSALLPGVPTLAMSGLPGYESASVYGFFAPARTPKPILKRLNEDIVAALGRREVKAKLASVGAEAVASSPEELARTIKADIAISGKLIKEARIRSE
jgi:tripartite-type tricarboxylate transporter receptor subunit TctC